MCVDQQGIPQPFFDCLMAHEHDHVSFIHKWAPCNACSDRKDGDYVGSEKDFKDWGFPEGHAIAECHGNKIEFDCLKKHEKESPNPAWIEIRRENIREYVKSTFPVCYAEYWQ